MVLEDALREVAKNIKLIPYSVLHQVMDVHPLAIEANPDKTGEIYQIYDEESSQGIVLNANEAEHYLTDIVPEFQAEIACDGEGNFAYSHRFTRSQNKDSGKVIQD